MTAPRQTIQPVVQLAPHLEEGVVRMLQRLPQRYWDRPLEGLEVDEHNHTAIVAAHEFVRGEGRPLLLQGNIGVGKTSALCGAGISRLIHVALEEECVLNVEYLSSADAFLELFQLRVGASFDHADRLMNKILSIRKCDLLLFDDITSNQNPKDWEVEKVNSLIDHRSSDGLPTCVASNHSLKSIGQIWGERMEDRLREMCRVVTMTGPSRRK